MLIKRNRLLVALVILLTALVVAGNVADALPRTGASSAVSPGSFAPGTGVESGEPDVGQTGRQAPPGGTQPKDQDAPSCSDPVCVLRWALGLWTALQFGYRL